MRYCLLALARKAVASLGGPKLPQVQRCRFPPVKVYCNAAAASQGMHFEVPLLCFLLSGLLQWGST